MTKALCLSGVQSDPAAAPVLGRQRTANGSRVTSHALSLFCPYLLPSFLLSFVPSSATLFFSLAVPPLTTSALPLIVKHLASGSHSEKSTQSFVTLLISEMDRNYCAVGGFHFTQVRFFPPVFHLSLSLCLSLLLNYRFMLVTHHWHD